MCYKMSLHGNHRFVFKVVLVNMFMALGSSSPSCSDAASRMATLRLSGGGTANARQVRPMSKADLAGAAEGPETVIPHVFADSRDDADYMQSDAHEAVHDSSGVSVEDGMAGEENGQRREWNADDMQAVQDKYMSSLFTDPHVPLTLISGNDSISKLVVQPGTGAHVSPQSGDRVFFHYELCYEDSMVASSRVFHGYAQPSVSLLLGENNATGDGLGDVDGVCGAPNIHPTIAFLTNDLLVLGAGIRPSVVVHKNTCFTF